MASRSSDTFNHFHAYADALPRVVGQIVRKAAMDIESAAKTRAPVDTGFMKNSIYSKTSEGSSYGGETGGAGGDKASQVLLPEVEERADETTAWVGVGAAYGLYVEMGTVKMPAQPFFLPAVEAVRPRFAAAMGALESKLREHVGGGGGGGGGGEGEA